MTRAERTRTDERSARYTFPGLVLAGHRLAEFARTVPSYSDPAAAHLAWDAERQVLVSDLRAEEARVAGLLCSRCNGTGQTQYRHRSGGVCYSCMGSGWSAKGRKAKAKA